MKRETKAAEKRLNEAEEKLIVAADSLSQARDRVGEALNDLRKTIEFHLVRQHASIEDLAVAARKARNYIDRIKATSDAAPLRGVKGSPVHKVRYDPETSKAALDEVRQAADAYEAAQKVEADAIRHRDKVICSVYAADLMGPTGISRKVNIDRNSVMRITRAAGVPRKRKGASV